MKKDINLINKNSIMKKSIIAIVFLMIGLGTIGYAETYFKSTTGTFMISLQDYFGNPVNGNCTGYIFYPNMTLYKSMNLTYNSEAGVYYSYFNVPDVEGTYLEVAKCKIGNPLNETIYGRKTFRVSDALGEYQTDIHNLISNSTLNMTLNITGNLTQSVSDVPFETWKFFKMMQVSGVTLDDPQYCLNSTHLLVYTTRHICISGKCFDINSTDVERCPYGCDNVTQSCAPPKYKQNIYLVVLIAILGFIMFILYKVIRR